MHRSLRVALVATLALTACAAGTGEPSVPTDTAPSAESQRTGETEAPRATPGADAGAGSTATSLPTSADAMNAWLHEGSYKTWAKESAPHPSTGPHASLVLTYINDALDASLASGGAEHPAGAAAVKEFLDDSGVTGWAVGVKTDAASNGGQGWYWYETFTTKPGSHGIEGQGKSLCSSCHESGRDYVLTPYPLR